MASRSSLVSVISGVATGGATTPNDRGGRLIVCAATRPHQDDGLAAAESDEAHAAGDDLNSAHLLVEDDGVIDRTRGDRQRVIDGELVGEP